MSDPEKKRKSNHIEPRTGYSVDIEEALGDGRIKVRKKAEARCDVFL